MFSATLPADGLHQVVCYGNKYGATCMTDVIFLEHFYFFMKTTSDVVEITSDFV